MLLTNKTIRRGSDQTYGEHQTRFLSRLPHLYCFLLLSPPPSIFLIRSWPVPVHQIIWQGEIQHVLLPSYPSEVTHSNLNCYLPSSAYSRIHRWWFSWCRCDWQGSDHALVAIVWWPHVQTVINRLSLEVGFLIEGKRFSILIWGYLIYLIPHMR